MKLKRNIAVASVVLTVYSTSVFAGFEWKGMGAPSSPSSSQSVPAVPVQKVITVDQAPVSLTSGSTVASASVKPLSPPPSLPMPMASAPGEPQEDVLSGFGNNLPLSVAMQQVIPDGFTFTLASDVDSNAKVSWKGGKPWKQVLAVMLAPQDLGYTVRGDEITVSRFTNEAAPPAGDAPVSLIARLEEPGSMPVAKNAVGEASLPPVAEQPVTELQDVVMADPVLPTPVGGQRVVTPVGGQLIAKQWVAERGRTLREVLTEWTGREGVALYWTLDYDYRLHGQVTYSGSFAEAVGRLLAHFTDSRPQPFGQLHLNPNAPKVLVIGSYDVPH